MGRHHIRTIVAELKARGKTILMSSHILGDVEAIADRAVILSEGRLRRVVDLDDREADRRGLEIQCRALPEGAEASIQGEGITCERNHDVVNVRVGDRDAVAGIIQEIQRAGGYLLQVRPVRMDLERIFLQEVTNGAPGTGTGNPDADAETREHVRRILDHIVTGETHHGDREEVTS
jgi:ABC-2 type transport system ATP-binding protein